ncbi:hypothetical protein [Pontibacter litorisediminis]|uniref:hypothetical protein n=1 Tax=Pontibacter litorisediminis TaxID=1846260 RepID=UPI0023ECE5EE|nr:hypothetical protein [Pontibacter litorisediminis]
MTIEYTIPIWGVIVFTFPLLLALTGGAIRLIYKQKAHDESIKTLGTRYDRAMQRIDELEEDMEGRQNQLYQEMRSLDQKVGDQRLLLEKILTTLEFLKPKSKVHESN